MCTIADWNRKDGNMKPELFEKIARELEQNADRVKRVHLYRDGEPLLDKRLPARIARLKRAKIREVGISTNAALLSNLKARELYQAGLDELILSVDSLKKDVYEKIRVGLNFYDVIPNCVDAIEERNILDSDCRVRVRMIRQESNKQEWEDGSFRKFWESAGIRGGDSIEFRNIHNWGGQLDGFKSIIAADTTRPCLALWSLFVIFADGTVPLCNVDYNAKHKLGNVNNSSIADLWQSIEQNRRRELHKSHNRAAIPPCKNCTVWSEEARAA